MLYSECSWVDGWGELGFRSVENGHYTRVTFFAVSFTDTVFVSLSALVGNSPAPTGKEATEKDLVALSRQLRVSQLSQSVRDCVLPELPWVREDYLLPVFATAFRRCGAAASKEITSLSISPSWSAPARVMKAREWFVWRVPVSAVTEMLEDVEEDCAEREHYSGEFYSDGATFRAYLELSSHRLNMKLYVYVLNESGHILDVSYCIKQSCPGRFGIDEDRVISE
eukprot:scaffold221877_cov14-Tisochrysis_lutea.AAC.1